MLLPPGPVKLALATGAPIVPVFCVRTPTGNVRLCVEPAIDVAGKDVEHALREIADVIGRYVRRYPEQWLMLQPAWREGTLP
jgi:KDO2-lipid IV(A) lauroyltransferase